MRRTLLLLLALGLVVGGGWWWSARQPGPDLALLRDDVLASWLPAGTTLRRAHESGSGTALGMPQYARVTRVIDLGERDPGTVLEEVGAVAEEGGWTVGSRRDQAVSASRRVPDWRLSMVAAVSDVPGLEGDLVVSLTAYPA